jgi:hypothetical protein
MTRECEKYSHTVTPAKAEVRSFCNNKIFLDSGVRRKDKFKNFRSDSKLSTKERF